MEPCIWTVNCLIQSKMLLAVLTGRAHCWLRFSLPTRTPRSFSAKAAFQPVGPQTVLVHVVTPPQVEFQQREMQSPAWDSCWPILQPVKVLNESFKQYWHQLSTPGAFYQLLASSWTLGCRLQPFEPGSSANFESTSLFTYLSTLH